MKSMTYLSLGSADEANIRRSTVQLLKNVAASAFLSSPATQRSLFAAEVSVAEDCIVIALPSFSVFVAWYFYGRANRGKQILWAVMFAPDGPHRNRTCWMGHSLCDIARSLVI